MLSNFLHDEDGATGIEYGMIAAATASVVGLAAWWFGEFLSWGFTTMADCIEVSFDPQCYSESSNADAPTRGDEAAWWVTE